MSLVLLGNESGASDRSADLASLLRDVTHIRKPTLGLRLDPSALKWLSIKIFRMAERGTVEALALIV